MKALLIGESCSDVYHYGEVKRISPEAPIPILDLHRTEVKDGMSLNVKNNLEAFGVDVTHVTQNETIKKHRFIDEKTGQQLLRVDDKVHVIHNRVIYTSEFLSEFDFIVISDYNKGFLDLRTIDAICSIAHKLKKPVFLDTKKNVFNLEYTNTFIKINEDEYDKLSLATKHRFVKNLIVTLGKNGCRYKDRNYLTESVDVYDVCGAGDVFLAAFSTKYTEIVLDDPESKELDYAFHYANACATESVRHLGTYTINPNDIKVYY